MKAHRHSIFCILPPHIVKKIAENGTAKQKAMALKTLTATAQLKGQRHLNEEPENGCQSHWAGQKPHCI